MAGDAALWTDEDPDLGVVAELLALVDARRGAARDAGRAGPRAARGVFAPERTEAKLREAIDAARV